jgi:hypothetical protein
MRSHRRECWLLGAVFALAFAPPALAVDGVLEINHAAALAGGVTPGDAAGYPVTLSTSGSYRLTSNLTPPDQNTDVIDIGSTSNVSIDLNGFSILGTAVCTVGPGGYVTSCSNTGSGSGISGSGSAIAIQRGFIQGMGNLGISMASAMGVGLHDLGINSNGGGGVETSNNAYYRDVIVLITGGTGIKTGFASRLIDSQASGNSGNGVDALQSLRVEGGQFGENGMVGIVAGNASTIRRARVIHNAGDGISVGYSALLTGNMVSFNGGYGIQFTPFPLPGLTTTGYADNLITFNSSGERNGTGGTQMGTNICGAAVCP